MHASLLQSSVFGRLISKALHVNTTGYTAEIHTRENIY